MTEETFDWRPFLTRWSEEWAGAYADPSDLRTAGDGEAWQARWLGFEPAPEERIAAAEERLGRRLPPSYRAFLEVTDGWRETGGSVYRLAGTAQAHWHEDAFGLSEYFDEGELRGMWARALQLDVESDMTTVLLDPLAAGEDGEWAVYCHSSWAGSGPTRYDSFREFMFAMYRRFHGRHAGRPGPAFVNDTTRRLDAQVAAARLEALRGGYEPADAALTEAAGFGRPRALGMSDQLRRFQGKMYAARYGGLAHDPLYFREFAPLLAVDLLEMGRDPADWIHTMSDESDERRAAAAEIVRELKERTFRYTAPGPFGEAVGQAREQARWGRTDAAWRTLLAALPQWTPLGPDHLAPVGLLTDPLLGPLVTPERGRELLATPRGPEAAPEQGLATEGAEGSEGEDGLAWLAEPPPHNRRPESYRFVLVEGAAPAELPARLGGPGAVLGAPMTSWELDRSRFRSGVSSTYDDCAVVVVGHAGGSGWSFALDPFVASHDPARFVSPAVAASQAADPSNGAADPSDGVAPAAGGRAVVVWCAPEHGLFHLSVAERGVERYAFTVDGTGISRNGGPIPPGLDPDTLFGAPTAPADSAHGEPDRSGERRALTAIAAEFGVGLPRFAVTEGRLHTFTTRSWTRPPGPGETYAVLTLGGRPG
ncbi:SMI1/KNR4 family protein [Kitasatospora xanthocidica]|uniref:SMI1/KNR4 family protein n=1 Tax=Kitasatospora xanthocidica TaxID=83382 RepID=UPI0036E9DD69